MQLLITRPQAEAEALSQRLAEMGHKALIEPMLTIRTLPDAVLELDAAAALLLTSANGVRALAGRAVDRGMLVLAVGEATAAAARAAGFTNVAAAGGDVVALAALVRKRLRPEDGVLVHVAGSAVAGDLAGDLGTAGYRVRRAVLYRAETSERLSEACRTALSSDEIDGVLFFSPRSAATFVKLLQRDGLVDICRGIMLFGLSDAVGEAAAELPWKGQRIAAMPRQDDLLALL